MTDILISIIVTLAHALGDSFGWAILALSLCIRVALLPLSIRISQRARRNREVARAMQPEIEGLKRRFEKQPERLFAEFQKVHKKHGYSPFDFPAIIGSFMQIPVFGLLYSAIRRSIVSAGPFLWIRSLASSDLILSLIVLSLTGLSVYFFPSSTNDAKLWMIAIQVLITGFMIWKLAAGLSLYWLASNIVSLIHNFWLRRHFPLNGMRT